MRISDWSSDVCSSDLLFLGEHKLVRPDKGGGVPLPTGVHAIAERQVADPALAIGETRLKAVGIAHEVGDACGCGLVIDLFGLVDLLALAVRHHHYPVGTL